MSLGQFNERGWAMDVVLPALRSDVFYRNLPSKNKMAPHDRPVTVVGCLCAFGRPWRPQDAFVTPFLCRTVLRVLAHQ
eukprot:2455591-Heterocapsa_arctica.AAC.1